MELEAYDSGVLLKQAVKEGDRIPIGGLLAIIGEKGEDISTLLTQPVPKPKKSSRTEMKVEPIPSAMPIEDTRPDDKLVVDAGIRIKASPLARKMAKEQGVASSSGFRTGG